MKGDTVVYLKDGRQIDISDLTVTEALALLRESRVSTEDVDRTVHVCRGLRIHPVVRSVR